MSLKSLVFELKRELDLAQVMDNYKSHLQQVTLERRISGQTIVDDERDYSQRLAREKDELKKELELIFQNKLREAIEAEALKMREESKAHIESIELQGKENSAEILYIHSQIKIIDNLLKLKKDTSIYKYVLLLIEAFLK